MLMTPRTDYLFVRGFIKVAAQSLPYVNGALEGWFELCVFTRTYTRGKVSTAL